MVTLERVESRADLAEAMTHICHEAMAERRRGLTGTLGHRYAELHEMIDGLLYAWQDAPR